MAKTKPNRCQNLHEEPEKLKVESEHLETMAVSSLICA